MHPAWLSCSQRVWQLLIFGSYVEANVYADESALAGLDGGADEDGAEDAGVLGDACADVVGVGAGDADVCEAEDGDGVGEADERRLGDADADVDALAD